ncbi:AAA family ATPase [Methanobacterium paludis]|uniref:ATPase n=1 Tax=Methanobacterium paludis (strain DSM 25820 / JCM 18151 / SWAN1) TaxID=868131 RepID=F6D780_METPW|nr:ATP-binding protein [Methanobacterium paludis]AEG18414.1 ATPase [Methanobacterium paludis]
MPSLPLGIPSDLDRYFYNREKELINLKSLLSTLNQNVANQIIITGHRGIGKSFLLKKLVQELPSNILTAYVDISKIYGIHKGVLTEESIMDNLLEEMNKAIGEESDISLKVYNAGKDILRRIRRKNYDFKEAGSILGIPIPDVTDNYEKLSKFVMEYPQKVVESSEGKINGFVIVIDEFQLIGEINSPEAFFWMFRSYTQDQDNVSYIFTGSTSSSSDIVGKINGINGAFGGRMIQFNVDNFSRDETEGYLKEKVPEIKFTDDGLERFYKCTRGYPSYINSFCNTMSTNIVYDNDRVVEEFYQKIDQIAIKWIFQWATLSKREKCIITVVIDNGPLTWGNLVDKVDFSDRTLAKYLSILKNKGIITHSDRKYKIDDHMLSAWLKYRKENDGFYPP